MGIYGKGIVKTIDGHLRYTSPKIVRNKYVHRVVIEKLIEETPYSIRLLLPWPFEVHHSDYDKCNNAPENLIMLSNAVHSALTADRKRIYGKFRPKWGKPPDWLPLYDGMEDDIPF